jgi:N-acetyltransferase
MNTACKYLLLEHAFEHLGCLRVEFKTDSLNMPSRAAIRRLGAEEEGILRNHRIYHDGRIRHSALFSITDEAWRGKIKAALQEKLNRTPQ